MKNNLRLFFIGILTTMIMSSCQYKFIEPEVVVPPDPNVPVKFSTEILPIWNTNGNCTSCHKPGGQSPDLTEANAYTQIYSKNLVDTLNPAASKIYAYPLTNAATHTWKQYKQSQADLILLWIQQGGKNN